MLRLERTFMLIYILHMSLTGICQNLIEIIQTLHTYYIMKYLGFVPSHILDFCQSDPNEISRQARCNYDPPNEVGGSLCFCLVRLASVRPGGKKKYCLKTRFRGFWACFGCFWRFRLLSVRPGTQWAMFCAENLS